MHTLSEQSYNLGISPKERTLEQLIEYGIVVIDKPRGPSSHEVSSFVKKICHCSKAGHSGTLDPDVSGVLPVLLSSSTKLAGFLLKEPKEYVCAMRTEKVFTKKEIDLAFNNFKGKIYQTPPLQSAVKRQLRTRMIYSLDVLEYKENLVLFSCRVQAGTYIRTIVNDCGIILGCKTEMAELRRTSASGFNEKSANTLQDLSDKIYAATELHDESFIRKTIIPIENILKMPRVVLSDDAVKQACKGVDPSIQSIGKLDESILKGQYVGLFTGKGELVAIAIALMDFKQIVSLSSEQSVYAAFDLIRLIHPF